jgi:hypothetical protein
MSYNTLSVFTPYVLDENYSTRKQFDSVEIPIVNLY